MCAWLGKADEELGINFFAEFTVTQPNGASTREFLDAWFRRADHSDEYSFETIGVDGGGGHFVGRWGMRTMPVRLGMAVDHGARRWPDGIRRLQEH